MSSLVCNVCSDEFEDNDQSEKAPKILQCGHTFCSKCIKEKMVKNNEIICLIDRQKDERPFDKIPINRILYDLILKEREEKNIIKIQEIKDYDLTLNIGMIGCQNTGKTSLSKCYQSNEPCPEEDDSYTPTISLDYFSRKVNKNGLNIVVRIWDTAGQERFNSITSGYLKGLHGCFIVFDVTDRLSFDKLNMWIQFYEDFNQYKERIMIILGNKIDKKVREVDKLEGFNYANNKGLAYFGTSAKNMTNVNEAFDEMINMILLSQDNDRDKDEIKLESNKSKKRHKKKDKNMRCC